MGLPYGSDGSKYLKTGDESGNLCVRCDIPMLIDKRGITVKNKDGKEVHKKGWYEYCRCCGRTIEFSGCTHHSRIKSVYV
jgi:hypothetical protein